MNNAFNNNVQLQIILIRKLRAFWCYFSILLRRVNLYSVFMTYDERLSLRMAV